MVITIHVNIKLFITLLIFLNCLDDMIPITIDPIIILTITAFLMLNNKNGNIINSGNINLPRNVYRVSVREYSVALYIPNASEKLSLRAIEIRPII